MDRHGTLLDPMTFYYDYELEFVEWASTGVRVWRGLWFLNDIEVVANNLTVYRPFWTFEKE